jgi:hypothetical protein
VLEKNLFDLQLNELNRYVNTLFFVFIDTNSFHRLFNLKLELKKLKSLHIYFSFYAKKILNSSPN